MNDEDMRLLYSVVVGIFAILSIAVFVIFVGVGTVNAFVCNPHFPNSTLPWCLPW